MSAGFSLPWPADLALPDYTTPRPEAGPDPVAAFLTDTSTPMQRAEALLDEWVSGDDPYLRAGIADALTARGLVPDEVAWRDAVDAETALRDLRDSGINTTEDSWRESQQQVHLDDALAVLAGVDGGMR